MCDSRFLLEAEASRNGEAYSNNLWERVVAAITGGRTCRETAALFGVSVASAARWLQRQRQTGNASAKRMGGFKFHKLEGERDWILARSAKAPDLTSMALQAQPAERSVAVRYGAIWLLLRPEGISFKKSVRPAEQDRADIARRRDRWRRYQKRIAPSPSGVHRRDLG
jgi:transposase